MIRIKELSPKQSRVRIDVPSIKKFIDILMENASEYQVGDIIEIEDNDIVLEIISLGSPLLVSGYERSFMCKILSISLRLIEEGEEPSIDWHNM